MQKLGGRLSHVGFYWSGVIVRAKGIKMGGAESFEHVQKPATAIQDHVSSPNSIYKVRQACTFETKTSGLISIQTVWHLYFIIVEILFQK